MEMRTMEVVDYSEQWPVQYTREDALLREILGEDILRVHHIGSTAVPGLAAKPVIDILLEVRSLDALDQRDDAMRTIGYEPRGEFGIPGRRYYPKGGDRRTHHVHAFVAGDPQVEQHLAFRDYLCAHPGIAAEYAEVKRRASATHRTDPDGYCAFKKDFVERTVAAAVQWVGQDDK
jgi:GrpB-like predicted nucleotidyltransferase (UPF0157 family)